MILKPASSLREFRSLAFVFTISMICLRVTLPTFVLFGSFEPAAMLAAFLRRIAAGGLLVMKVKDLSLKTVMTTGKNVARLLLGGGVKFFAEGHDVDAARSERGADGRGGVGLAGRDLQFDVSDDFFSHDEEK